MVKRYRRQAGPSQVTPATDAWASSIALPVCQAEPPVTPERIKHRVEVKARKDRHDEQCVWPGWSNRFE